MSVVSANEATKTHFCKYPGCGNEARSPVGRYAYCAEHQGKAPKPTASRNGAVSHGDGAEAALRELLGFAKKVDRAKAKAEKLRQAANDADRQADDLAAEYQDAIAAAIRGAS